MIGEKNLPEWQKGEVRMIGTPRGEKLQWLLTIGNTVSQIVEMLSGIGARVPKEWKQRLPGFLGLSLEDERIFNGVLAQLEPDLQAVITEFLIKKCKDFQRNRFINIVAGMEVEKGTPQIVERKWNNKTKGWDEKIVKGKVDRDRRQDFLESFANMIIYKYDSNLSRAYQYCIAGRMILKNSIFQKITDEWRESIKWFEKNVLNPLKVSSLEEIGKKIGSGIQKVAVATEIDKGAGKAADWINNNIHEKVPKYKSFWKAAFPKAWQAVCSIIFAVVVIIMLICGMIFS